MPPVFRTKNSSYFLLIMFSFLQKFLECLEGKIKNSPGPVKKIMYLSAAYEYQHLYIAQQVGLCSNVPIMPIKTIAENSGMTVRKPTPSKTDGRSESEIRDLQILLRFYWLRGVILKKPRAWISDVLAGKLDSHHSTTAFSENVVVTETSYQMEEILSFCDRKRALTLSIK